ncbi:MAG: hypothetical protein LBQ66_07735 [Planctomycetaceae bacterium]|nr:hypothetical protein [Planctomycetaceae bacterium]
MFGLLHSPKTRTEKNVGIVRTRLALVPKGAGNILIFLPPKTETFFTPIVGVADISGLVNQYVFCSRCRRVRRRNRMTVG